MVTRRALIVSGAVGLLVSALPHRAFAAPPSPTDPAGIIAAIYTRAAKGKGDGGGAFIIENKAALAVIITGRNTPARKPADQTIRYAFVRDATEWKIDDIKGASDGEPWSIRDMLTDSLKN